MPSFKYRDLAISGVVARALRLEECPNGCSNNDTCGCGSCDGTTDCKTASNNLDISVYVHPADLKMLRKELASVMKSGKSRALGALVDVAPKKRGHEGSARGK